MIGADGRGMTLLPSAREIREAVGQRRLQKRTEGHAPDPELSELSEVEFFGHRALDRVCGDIERQSDLLEDRLERAHIGESDGVDGVRAGFGAQTETSDHLGGGVFELAGIF